MLDLKKGDDILSGIGDVSSIDKARDIFDKKIDQENLDKLAKIKNEEVLLKIANAISICDPDSVFVNTGSPDDLEKIRQQSIEKGEEKPLAMKGHTIHFDLAEEQARLIKSTFYIVNENEETSPTARKILRQEGCDYVKSCMTNIMRGKKLYVGFYSRGPIGAQGSIPALEMSSSTYVMHSAGLLYRNAYGDFDKECSRFGRFFTNLHSEGLNRPEDLPNARIFMDRSWLTTFSMLCTYAGNTLLLKKGNHRFSVDLATYYKKGEDLSEHMFITGMTGSKGRKTYFAGAAPSGCGKTTTAMVGTDFIGDDLAQLWVADDGTLRAVNPEIGIFGIVEDVNREGDPYLMKCLREPGAEVIWSNVLIDDNSVPHWVGNGETPPKKGVNFQGEWSEGKTGANGKPVPISHPNSRCTLENINIGNYNQQQADDPAGVPIKVLTYSGRDSDTMPPVWAAKSADHGVAIGASLVSAATATEIGATGVRRQPWANEPFIPGPLGDYMEAQFLFFNSSKFSSAGKPIMAGLNYFLTHAARGGSGKGILGEKKDVKVWLGWLEKYAWQEVKAIATPIGYLPYYEDLKELFDGIDKPYGKDLYDMQFSLYIDNILARIALQKEAYAKEPRIPKRLFEVYEEQAKDLEALKDRLGAIVKPDDLV